MDCNTARLLLDFARPRPRELEAEEAGALEGHLDRCSECHGLADGQRRLDERLGQAMRQVEVPAGLHEQLLARLESERGEWHRRRFAHTARIAVAAAAVLVLGWAGWHWMLERASHAHRPGTGRHRPSTVKLPKIRAARSRRPSSTWAWRRPCRPCSITTG